MINRKGQCSVNVQYTKLQLIPPKTRPKHNIRLNINQQRERKECLEFLYFFYSLPFSNLIRVGSSDIVCFPWDVTVTAYGYYVYIGRLRINSFVWAAPVSLSDTELTIYCLYIYIYCIREAVQF